MEQPAQLRRQIGAGLRTRGRFVVAFGVADGARRVGRDDERGFLVRRIGPGQILDDRSPTTPDIDLPQGLPPADGRPTPVELDYLQVQPA